MTSYYVALPQIPADVLVSHTNKRLGRSNPIPAEFEDVYSDSAADGVMDRLSVSITLAGKGEFTVPAHAHVTSPQPMKYEGAVLTTVDGDTINIYQPR